MFPPSSSSYAERHQERHFKDALPERRRDRTPPAQTRGAHQQQYGAVSPSLPAWVGLASHRSSQMPTAGNVTPRHAHFEGDSRVATEWSGRVTSPDRRTRSMSNRAVPLQTQAAGAVCWMCAKPCTAYGWCQVNSSFVHRIVFYPASLFTLCATCGRAISLAPGASLVDVIRECHQTSATRSHSHAFVTFVREYMMLLETAYLDLEDAAARDPSAMSRTTSSTRRAIGQPSSRPIRRDDVLVLPPRIVDSLNRCVSEFLRDREALTLKEAHLLMTEGATLQAHAEQNGYSAIDYAIADARVSKYHDSNSQVLSPEQRYLRSHPLLDVVGTATTATDTTSFFTTSRPPGASRHAPAAVSSQRAAPAADADQQDVVFLNGRRFVLAPSPEDAGRDTSVAVVHGDGRRSAPVAAAVPATLSSRMDDGPSKRLLEAAEEFAVKEQQHALEREDCEAERQEVKRHLVNVENENRILRERLSVKDKESDTLVMRNTQMAERIATLDTSSTMQAHFALLFRIAVNHANLAAEQSAAKAKAFVEATETMVSSSIALGRQLRKTKEELEQTKLHVLQQRKMLEATRRTVMQAWSEKAGIGTGGGGNGSTKNVAGSSAKSPVTPVWEQPPAFSDTETTLF
jgi:hypothetical protein